MKNSTLYGAFINEMNQLKVEKARYWAQRKFVSCLVGLLVCLCNLSMAQTNPTHVGSIVHGTGKALLCKASSVFISGKYAYVVGCDALQILDISDPAVPFTKGNLTNGTGGAKLSAPASVYVSGNYV